MTKPLPPGSVLGILGGGQLGRMMALEAAPLGYECHIFCPAEGPATQVTSRMTLAAYDDWEALAAFADAVDVVTYEFENVPAETAAFLAARVPVRPGPRALEICQHRVLEKSFLSETVGVPTAPWISCQSAADVAAGLETLGTKAVLKTARFGYDGKGQTFISPGDDVAEAWSKISGGREEIEAILEGFVPFEREASVVVARDIHGNVAAYDLVENLHSDHILHQTLAPARVNPEVAQAARALAERVVTTLEYVGVMGVEMFVKGDGSLVVNELAPRPHNSGHWTQDGARTNQFEQAVRAAMGCPLGSPERLFDVVMHNLLGDEVNTVEALLSRPEAKIHLYGKANARKGRKMGHVNLVGKPVTSSS